MINRLAACMSLLAFAVCLVIGGVQAGNGFATTVWRALVAMAVTLIIGLVLGAMAKAMLEENLSAEQKKIENSSPKPKSDDR